MGHKIIFWNIFTFARHVWYIGMQHRITRYGGPNAHEEHSHINEIQMTMKYIIHSIMQLYCTQYFTQYNNMICKKMEDINSIKFNLKVIIEKWGKKAGQNEKIYKSRVMVHSRSCPVKRTSEGGNVHRIS